MIPTPNRALIARAEHLEARTAEEFVRAAPADLAERLGVAGEWLGPVYRMQARAVDVLMFNRALHLGLAEPATEAALDAIVGAFRAAGVARFFIQVAPGAEPADRLPGWLAARGLAPYNRWMRLAGDPAARLPVGAVPAAWPVDEIGPAEAAAFSAIDGRGFDLPPAMWPWTAALVGRPGWRHFVARDGATPIATAAMFTAGDLAWFGFAATLEAYRGRGAQSTLIAHRLAAARAAGCRHAIVETAEDRPDKPAPSFRNLVRLGFRVLYARDNWLGLNPAGAAGRTPALC
jgi:GNAT superfamily N-acetyltransferase